MTILHVPVTVSPTGLAGWIRQVATVINQLIGGVYSAGSSFVWGSGTGTLSDQTDLQTALNAKQATLVSGTNIKTVNSTTLLGSGNLAVGTVTSASVVTANGVSGSVATATTTPAITLTLGAITPSSVAASGTVTGSNLSGTNTGDQTSVSGNAGTATALATGRTLAITGDLAWTSPSFDGTGNVTAAGTLANTAVTPGSYTLASITVDAKGRITAASNGSAGSGTVTTTGSPASGNLAKFSGATSIVNGDLSGDVTTSGALVATVTGPVAPRGRLTLVTAVAVMTSDQTAKTAIYYTPYVGDTIPVYDGTVWARKTFTELTLSLDTTNHTSGSVYDIFICNDSGTIKVGTGPSWSSTTTRGTGAGTTELERKNGIWTNKNSIALKNGSGAAFATISANQATYVGTFYATANGQTGMAFSPAAAAGGANAILGLWNAYNRVSVSSVSRDSTATYSYNSTTVRSKNASASNRISYIDGLGESSVIGTVWQSAGSVAGDMYIGLARGSTSAFDFSGQGTIPGITTIMTVTVPGEWVPTIGLSFIQALEATSANLTFYGAFATPTRQLNGLTATLWM